MPGVPIPEFMRRFGPAYQAELAHFVDCCRGGTPFDVNQNDGLRAGEIAAAGMTAVHNVAAEQIRLT